MARRALLCTLVDPTLRGVIVSGPIGTGKSTLMRSFGAFVRKWIDPTMPFVQVPLGVGEDRLIGGCDIEQTLAAGHLRIAPGLIAEADGGFLFADDLPLLELPSRATIFEALEREVLLCEREGAGLRFPARFVLLGTTVPSERELAVNAADRVAFLVGAERRLSEGASAEMLRRLELFRSRPDDLARQFDEAEQKTAETVVQARLSCSFVRIDTDVAEAVAAAAVRRNIQGNRADVLALKAARAHAALRGALRVEGEDLEFAVAVVLDPRSENVPEDEQQQGEEETNEKGSEGNSEHEVERSGGEGDGARGGEGGSGGSDDESGDAGEGQGEDGLTDAERSGNRERIFDPLEFNGPLPELNDFFLHRNEGFAGSRGSRDEWRRGRHTRSVQQHPSGRRIAVGATLRAAAPHQKQRGKEQKGRVIVRSDDLRVKRFAERAGTLFIFCVDASGSMAMNRMREAKGAVTRLLQEAYINRDHVALIAFRGASAEVLLPPTGSVERAKRSLDVLPTGGGTPLASALMKAYAMTERARNGGDERVLVVLMTDGRANVPLAENAAGMIMEIRRMHVRRELDRIAEAYIRSGIETLLVDTRPTYGATSETIRLAALLRARYYFLPQFNAGNIAAVVRSAVDEQS